MIYETSFIGGEKYSRSVGKVVCVGRNYAAHAKELNNPVPSEPILFIKPETSVVSMAHPFQIPPNDCHYETEIAVLIGSRLTKADEKQAALAIVGIGLALDLTKRDLQSELKEQGHPWERAKSFDGACPMSAFVPRSKFQALDDISFKLYINDVLRQEGCSADMLTPIIPLLAHISHQFTLKPGDIVLTGTPQGVGKLHCGEHLRVSLMDTLTIETSTF